MVEISRSLRNRLLCAGVILLLAIAFVAGGFLGVPRLLRSQLQQFSQENYQRPLTMGEIRFNPFTLTLEAKDFSFPDADGTALLGFGRLLLNYDVASLWRRGSSFSVIELEKPFTNAVIRTDGVLNLADLARPFAEPPSAAEAAKPEPPPRRFFIDHFRLIAGRTSFEDRTRATPFRAHVRPISFELRDFSTTGKTGNTYSLQGSSVSGEHFDWNGNFSLYPLQSRGRFKVDALQARTLWSYLSESLDFELSSGAIGFSGDYEFASADTTEFKARIQQLGISKLGIRPPGAGEDTIHLEDIQVADTAFDLATLQVTVGNVRVNGGTVHAWQDAQGILNLDTLFGIEEEPQAAPVVTDAANNDDAWTLLVPQIQIEALKVLAEDRQFEPAAALTLDPVNLKVAGYSSVPGTKLDITASIGIDGTGTLKAQASMVPDTEVLKAQVDLSAFDLTAIQPYIAQQTQMTLLSGVLGAKLDIESDAAGAMVITGETDVANLRTVDNALRQDFIKWERLRATGIEYHSSPGSLRIKEIATRAPYARVIIAKDQTLNLSQVLTAGPAAAAATQVGAADSTGTGATGIAAGAASPGAATAADSAQPFAMAIGTVRIANGSANFADFWIQPNYAVSIVGLNGQIVGLSSDPNSRARMQLDGKVDRYAPASISGEVNLLSASLYTDIAMTFKGVEMTSVTPYSGRFAGYKIEKGKLSVDLKYHVENRQIKAEQRFVIDQLQLGERVESPDAIKLPLRLAIALLKDRNGVIDVPLPVTGSLDDPKFRIGPIIWKAVLNLLVKCVTAPFALLGSLFGGGEEMNLIDFEPGAAALDPASQERLGGLLKALKERPQLQLDVPMAYSQELDGSILAARQLDAKLLALAQQRKAARKSDPAEAAAAAAALLADPAIRFELLVEQHRADFGKDAPLPPAALAQEALSRRKRDETLYPAANTEMEQALIAKQPPTELELQELGKARAQAVQDVLLVDGEVDPGRVFLITPKQPTAVASKVRMELSLK